MTENGGLRVELWPCLLLFDVCCPSPRRCGLVCLVFHAPFENTPGGRQIFGESLCSEKLLQKNKQLCSHKFNQPCSRTYFCITNLEATFWYRNLLIAFAGESSDNFQHHHFLHEQAVLTKKTAKGFAQHLACARGYRGLKINREVVTYHGVITA